MDECTHSCLDVGTYAFSMHVRVYAYAGLRRNRSNSPSSDPFFLRGQLTIADVVSPKQFADLNNKYLRKQDPGGMCEMEQTLNAHSK